MAPAGRRCLSKVGEHVSKKHLSNGSKVVALAEQVRRRLIDYGSPGSVGDRFRKRRWRLLLDTFPDLADMEIVDLGGTAHSWMAAPVSPAHVTLVNLDRQDVPPDRPITAVQGDACEVPDTLRSNRFDLVFSNSLIEHVGGHSRREALAENIHRLADRHWVQTPYRYFPVEPHWLFPFFQVLPVAARARVVRSWHISGQYPSDRAQAVEWAMSIELLTRTEMRHYFPDSDLLAERVAGMTKSLIAVKRD